MNIHSSFILIAKNQKQPKCPLTCERNKKLWYIHTVEYYSVTKKKKPTTATSNDMYKRQEHHTSERR